MPTPTCGSLPRFGSFRGSSLDSEPLLGCTPSRKRTKGTVVPFSKVGPPKITWAFPRLASKNHPQKGSSKVMDLFWGVPIASAPLARKVVSCFLKSNPLPAPPPLATATSKMSNIAFVRHPKSSGWHPGAGSHCFLPTISIHFKLRTHFSDLPSGCPRVI